MSAIDWSTLHAYRRLANEGKVKKLACPDCEAEYVPAIGPDEEPVLLCFFCSSAINIGLRMAGDIKAVVKEHSG